MDATIEAILNDAVEKAMAFQILTNRLFTANYPIVFLNYRIRH